MTTMMVTEKEARQMICPMSLSTTPVTTVFWAGPLCMAWQWENKLELSWTDEFPPKDDGLGKWKLWQHRADGKVG